jgi:hypothetical protein
MMLFECSVIMGVPDCEFSIGSTRQAERAVYYHSACLVFFASRAHGDEIQEPGSSPGFCLVQDEPRFPRPGRGPTLTLESQGRLRLPTRRAESFQLRQIHLARSRNSEQRADDIISHKDVEPQCKKGLTMSMQLKFEEKPNYLFARITGTGAAEEIAQHFESLAKH